MLVLVGGEIESQNVEGVEPSVKMKEPGTSRALGEPIPHNLTIARHRARSMSRKKSCGSRRNPAETRPISAQKCVGNSRSMKRNRRLLRKILDLAQRLPTLRPASWSSVTRPHALGSSGNRPPTSGDPGESRARPKMGRPVDGGLPSTLCAGAALRSVRPGATQDRSGLEHLCARGTLPVDRDRVQRRRGANRSQGTLHVLGAIRPATGKQVASPPKADALAHLARLVSRTVGRRPARVSVHAHALRRNLPFEEMAFAWRRAEALIG